jgi:holo-[acyl-carrier protein] synthase
MDADGVVDAAFELIAIAEVASLPAGTSPFTPAENAYARSKSDPERRLAARLAAKRAAARLLGVRPEEIEVVRGPAGPPTLRLSERARASLSARGASRVLVSLTHGRTHAAASVLLVGGVDAAPRT